MLTMTTNYTDHNHNGNNDDDDNISMTILWINLNPFYAARVGLGGGSDQRDEWPKIY